VILDSEMDLSQSFCLPREDPEIIMSVFGRYPLVNGKLSNFLVPV
jgi:hypothetical protein